MKKMALISTLLLASSANAGLETTRAFHSYLVKITNNSSKTFKLYCNNKDWNVVLFSSVQQLEHFTEKFDQPTTKLQQEWYDVTDQKNIRVQELKVEQKTDAQIAQDPTIKTLTKRLDQLTEQLRPVIRPHSVTDNIPCRIFGPDDLPTDKPKGWRWPETYVKSGDTRIELVDTDRGDGCGSGMIKVTAKGEKLATAICVPFTLYFGQLHLIIEEDGTFHLEEITGPITSE